MGRWCRQEIEEAFEHYQQMALQAGTSGDWRAWADLFTEDATYIEHVYGTFGGREAIYNWIQKTMHTPPNDEMIHFPIDWSIIDEEKGWIVCKRSSRMATRRSLSTGRRGMTRPRVPSSSGSNPTPG